MAQEADPRVREAIAAYFDSINHERWERLAELFHPDAELRAPGTRPRVGGAAVASYYDDALRPYPEHRDTPTREIYAGDTVTVEIHFDGRLADGSPISFDAVDVFDFRDGRIALLTSWYDSQRVIRMLAEAATAGGPDGDPEGPGQITGARRRWAFGRVRRGAAFPLGGRWVQPAGDAVLAGRAVLLDLVGHGPLDADALDAAAERQGAAVRPGDIVLVRAGGDAHGSAPLGAWLAQRRLAGIATDGPAADAGPRAALGAHWALDALAEDCAARGSWDGLLVSAPSASGANAVVFR